GRILLDAGGGAAAVEQGGGCEHGRGAEDEALLCHRLGATVKPVLVLLPILGLTWLVGILVHLSPASAYTAVGLNSFQGPYIFLVYAACNRAVRSALQRMTEKTAAQAITVRAVAGAGGPVHGSSPSAAN
uniref:G-protein coupled receptors family 2 profile 2 domain-containing protein n=1 Tax=Loxodonta africana TaxID=9785 RepID=G3TL16_LOXAF